jgi:hypothetical protein
MPAATPAGNLAAPRLARVRMGIIADVHGNDVALRAILEDAGGLAVDRWWALGDLVLFGPRPAEVLHLLQGLPGISMLRGNTDRYVLTGEQPAPHATAADAAASLNLVRRYAAMAAGIGWTRGVLDQAAPRRMRRRRRGRRPHSLRHRPARRRYPGPQSRQCGMSRTRGTASWILLEDDGDALAVRRRSVPFDVDAVVSDLRRRRHPNAEFTASVITGQDPPGY